MNNNNNHNNQNNNNKSLNPLIFNNIIPLILSKITFNEILELSLISKSTFNYIQHLICDRSKELNIILGSRNSIKSYIDNSSNQDDKYIYKLIQYKEIKYINCRFNNSIFKREEINDYSEHKVIKDSNLKFKEYLNSKCMQLKRVNLIKHVYAATFGRGYYDYTEQGFYSFEGLWIQIDDDAYPVSSQDEEDKAYAIQNGEEIDQDEEVDVDKDENKLTVRTFNYSYDLVNNYQPRKVILSYADELSGAYGLHIYNFDNILNFKSIQVLKFNDQPTKPELVKKLIQSNTIQSLQLNYSPNGVYGSDEDDEEIVDNSKDYSIEIAQTLEQGQLSNNRVLRKLAFRNWNTCTYRDPLPLLKLLDSIKSTTRLSKLDLTGYEIQDSNLLKPLIGMPNISTLYFDFDELNDSRNDLVSLDAYLNHLNQNSNIKTFKCSLLYRYIKGHQHLQFNQLIDKLNQFFNSGNQSLELMVIKINFDFYDFNLPKVNEIKNQISTSLLNSNNKLLKLKWNFDNFTTRRY